MLYPMTSFLSVVVFSLVHLYANRTSQFSLPNKSRFLSLGGGVAISYVFVDLLPKLSKNDIVLRSTLSNLFPYLERHVYIMALIGFLLFLTVDRSRFLLRNQTSFFWLSLISYALFNFLVGYAVVDKDNPEVQPLFLFTFAMALHYFVNDYSLNEAHGSVYNDYAKWVLILSLFLGWFVGLYFQLSTTGVGLISAFIGGGVIMNVTRHELPENKPHSLGVFLLAAFGYTAVLLL